MRKCNGCGKEYPLIPEFWHRLSVYDNLGFRIWEGFYYQCKECRNAKKREWNKKNKDKIKMQNENYDHSKKIISIEKQAELMNKRR